MAKMSLHLSDTLNQLGQMLTPFEHEERVLRPHDARTLRRILKELGQEARHIENQLSAKLWNDQARLERFVDAEAIASAASQPGSNVRLFPVIPRPFTDGFGSQA
ncbi:hypothetical protein EOA37_09510 [Mesorhizobium sp. M2A.F.Ca.ET.015.02.1.1]|uniref:hypothetical protein n=1 Tax=Mesorhizobium sp. M2A.F.Ca.ET.015.02.1.1 TaxID=2496758 RepID=UPI000FCAAD66|nr:hypothetical protein [Mesorhizobium sp. M2A.F.Ca.ET.015.02.1.1]RUW41489.1 hypothetical protein EOA37_09510 [Mesorhizobium sp. M2A.F.Ca.ET.015.02.1.1]